MPHESVIRTRRAVGSVFNPKNCFAYNSRSLAMVAMLALTTASVAFAGTLNGTVVDPDGKPVPQAQVTLLRSVAVIDQTRTDNQGNFKISDVTNGKYQITASAPGLASPKVEVEVANA